MRLASFLEQLLRPLELIGEIDRRIRCIKWEQNCRFHGRNCLEWRLTCSGTKPSGRLIRELLHRA